MSERGRGQTETDTHSYLGEASQIFNGFWTHNITYAEVYRVTRVHATYRDEKAGMPGFVKCELSNMGQVEASFPTYVPGDE